MAEKTLKFGILGCGLIAQFHANSIGAIDRAELIGAADNNYDRAKAYADEHGIKAYRTYEKMLADENIDAVCICTPSGFHAENAIAALKAGKNVVLEKPMALNVEDTHAIVAACKESGKILTVVSQLRFSPDVNRVKKLVEEQAFGKIVFCDLDMKYWRDPEYFSSSPWKGTLKFDGGGALMNQGIHGIDTVLYIMGDAKVLSAKNKTAFHNIEVEDASVTMLEFQRDGALGVIKGSTCTYPGFDRTLAIMGTQGCAILRENKIEKLIVRGENIDAQNNGYIDGVEKVSNGGSSDPAAIDKLVHKPQFENFIAAVLDGEELLIDAVQGSRAIKLIEEIYKYN